MLSRFAQTKKITYICVQFSNQENSCPVSGLPCSNIDIQNNFDFCSISIFSTNVTLFQHLF